MVTADDVLNMRLTQVRFSQGYDQDEVDDFLDRVLLTLRGLETGQPVHDPVTPQDVREVRFRATRFRDGYDQDEVDDLLDRAAATLEALAERAAQRPAPDTAPPGPPQGPEYGQPEGHGHPETRGPGSLPSVGGAPPAGYGPPDHGYATRDAASDAPTASLPPYDPSYQPAASYPSYQPDPSYQPGAEPPRPSLPSWASGASTPTPAVDPVSAVLPLTPPPRAARGHKQQGHERPADAPTGPLTSDEVLAHRFTTVQFRDGYDPRQVEDLLTRVVETLGEHETGERAPAPVTAHDVREARFEATRFREGYEPREVDALLDRIVVTLGGRSYAPPPPPPGEPYVGLHFRGAPYQGAPPAPVESRRSWAERLFGS